jgi:hypothetical protein
MKSGEQIDGLNGINFTDNCLLRQSTFLVSSSMGAGAQSIKRLAVDWTIEGPQFESRYAH